MNFSFTDEQIHIQKLARDFARHEMLPYATMWDEDSIFPAEVLKKAACLGFAAIYVGEDVGGSQLKRLDGALLFTELAQACPSTAAYLSIHNMVAAVINQYGNEVQRQHWLPKLASMELFSSYCLTEPHSGSDAKAMKTTAEKVNGGYLINGSEAFISGGSMSDVYLCMVRVKNDDSRSITCFLIEKGCKGLSYGAPEKKLGWHSQPTTMVYFENCFVPLANRIGQEGEGFKIAMNALNGGRINIAACSLGGALACLQHAKQYMTQRQQFGHYLADFQALQFKLADMQTLLEAARLMVFRAADALDQNHPDKVMFCAMAKQFATDHCFQICNEALQLFGGYGYLKDYPIERYFRDLRVHQILEGTNEIMRIIIARHLLNEFKTMAT